MPVITNIETTDRANAAVNKQMLQLPDLLLQKGAIQLKGEFLEELGIDLPFITKVKKGDRFFSKVHIYIVCKKYKVNANWLLGLEKNPFR
ncbi:MAG: hypothetical protein EOO06_03905 [Chitinophagaceae bacterium]|nr:MAG: hypothetical protein EOO06_03905 [Chitinophagaceae bacterium]